MRATETLKAEHRGIRRALAVLEALAARADGGEAPRSGDAEALVEFFTVFADGCHHAKEERILFPELATRGLAAGQGPVDLLLEQHAEGRRLVGRLRRELPALDADPAARRRFAAAAHEYAALLEEHIALEDDVLFPDADGVLDAEADGRIAAAFDRHEELEMGAGVHERFHRMLDDLGAKYAGGKTHGKVMK